MVKKRFITRLFISIGSLSALSSILLLTGILAAVLTATPFISLLLMITSSVSALFFFGHAVYYFRHFSESNNAAGIDPPWVSILSVCVLPASIMILIFAFNPLPIVAFWSGIALYIGLVLVPIVKVYTDYFTGQNNITDHKKLSLKFCTLLVLAISLFLTIPATALAILWLIEAVLLGSHSAGVAFFIFTAAIAGSTFLCLSYCAIKQWYPKNSQPITQNNPQAKEHTMSSKGGQKEDDKSPQHSGSKMKHPTPNDCIPNNDVDNHVNARVRRTIRSIPTSPVIRVGPNPNALSPKEKKYFLNCTDREFDKMDNDNDPSL